tara:strand:- start:1227 stop:1451 length:225 start_codon:yes stop_codon:yes gene_type:complete
MKYIPNIIITLGLIILIILIVGCVCPQCDKPTYEGNPEFKPLPPEKLQDLLYKESANIAYKSVTKKDYEAKDEC